MIVGVSIVLRFRVSGGKDKDSLRNGKGKGGKIGCSEEKHPAAHQPGVAARTRSARREPMNMKAFPTHGKVFSHTWKKPEPCGGKARTMRRKGENHAGERQEPRGGRPRRTWTSDSDDLTFMAAPPPQHRILLLAIFLQKMRHSVTHH